MTSPKIRRPHVQETGAEEVGVKETGAEEAGVEETGAVETGLVRGNWRLEKWRPATGELETWRTTPEGLFLEAELSLVSYSLMTGWTGARVEVGWTESCTGGESGGDDTCYLVEISWGESCY